VVTGPDLDISVINGNGLKGIVMVPVKDRGRCSLAGNPSVRYIRPVPLDGILDITEQMKKTEELKETLKRKVAAVVC
jgi:hypothetical protein